ncbi:hypothetical protein BC939DRAFT_440590 [Gamsiella multidivaricata]|uniref:uncharacterized protein n=1 Tax=Gamsiella multidivaricata TaxID=101098 RepID=UPI00221ED25F|nr:uncharacterized protein BC939DRAFT_440590 [Gamsiella multidivaricata]KAG0366526.1 hypothetical protein BGZ54_005237 [Gamsiella multidivaricata]KAI7829791.1 hypothetical protein BC939DRAFT_440590 [Gamsiella multidivaricata]
MPAHSSTQAICTRILIRTRSRTALARRHQSTFSFFSRNRDTTPLPGIPTPSNTAIETKGTSTTVSSAASSAHSNDLKTSPSFANAAPLLAAIQNKDQDTAWMVYSVLSRAGQLSSLLPIHHSLFLRSIRPDNPNRYGFQEIAKLTERFEQVWAGMRECHIQPNMNDYTARLEFSVATRQYQMVDLTWTEMREKAGSSLVMDRGRATAAVGTHGPSVQPTLHTYNLILQSCVPRKNIGLAMETITLMRRAGIKPDNMSWDYVLQIHTKMKNWGAVESTFRSAFITPAVGSSGGQLQQYIQQNGSASSSSEWMTIPLGQRAKSLHGGVLSLNNNHGNNSNREKLVPTLQNVHTLFSFYAYTQDLEDLRHMFDSHVRLFGLVPTTRSYNEMIKFAFLARRDSDGLELFKELAQIGQNLDKMQHSNSSSNEDGQQQTRGHADPAQASLPVMQVCGPDFDTFQILIKNELIDARNRWGRAWKWIQVMQEAYGLEPSDKMFKRTLAAMKRRQGSPRCADEATVQALQANWDQVRARRESKAVINGGDGGGGGGGAGGFSEAAEEDDQELAQVTSSS